MRPLIAVCGQPLQPGQVTIWKGKAVGLRTNYLSALTHAGGLGAVLAPDRIDQDEATDRLSRFDGLMLIGGGDVDPAHYGEDPVPEVYGIDSEADLFEMMLLRAALERGMPVLAVCRGVQVMNVAMGGTLLQHIGDRDDLVPHGTPRDDPVTHPVRLEPGSWVAKAMGVEEPECVSSHHQALNAIGEGLIPVGWAEDGLVEAVERPNGSWCVGVQWHPERSADDPAQKGLFAALVEQASG